MTTSAGAVARHWTGDIEFLAGGLRTRFLIGDLVYTVAYDEETGALSVGTSDGEPASDVVNLFTVIRDSTTVFKLNEDGTRPDVTEAMWDSGALLIEPAGLYDTERHTVDASVGQWNRYNVANFYEAYNQYGFSVTAPNGSIGFTTHQHQFWTKNPAGIWRISGPPAGHNYIGDKSGEEAATASAQNNGDLAFFDGHLRVISNLVLDGSFLYEWKRIFPSPYRLEFSQADSRASEVYGEVSGMAIARAIDAHYTNQHFWVHQLRLDYILNQAGDDPSFRPIEGVGGVSSIEFHNLTEAQRDFLRSLANGSIIGLDGSVLTIAFSLTQDDGDLMITGAFDDFPQLTDGDSYILRFEEAPSVHDDTKLNTNLQNTDDDLTAAQQKIFVNRAGADLSGYGPPPQASIDYEGRRYVNLITDVEEVCRNIPHVASKSTGTFEDIDRDDFEYTESVERSDGSIDLLKPPVLGEWLYDEHFDTFYNGVEIAPGRVGWVSDTADDALAGSLGNQGNVVLWYGGAESDAEILVLLHTLPAGSEVFYFNGRETVIRRLQNNTYVAAGDRIDHLIWGPVKADARLADATFSEELDAARGLTPTLGDQFLARVGTARYVLPDSTPERDIDNIRAGTQEWGTLAATERYMYAGHGNAVFHRYLLADNGDTHDALGLAATMESAKNTLASPNSRFGAAIDGDYFYFGYRSAQGSHVIRWPIGDEDEARVVVQADAEEVISSALLPGPAAIYDIAVKTIAEGEVTGLDAGTYVIVTETTFPARNNLLVFRSVDGGPFTQLKIVAIGSVFRNNAVHAFGITLQVVNKQLLAYFIVPLGSDNADVGDGYDIAVYDVNSVVRVTDAQLTGLVRGNVAGNPTDIKGLEIAAVDGVEYLFIGGNNVPSLLSYRAYAYFTLGEVVRSAWPASARATAGVFFVGAHSEVIRWQYAATEPDAPPMPWDEVAQTFLADPGDWYTNEPAALAARTDASHALWVAYGGTNSTAGGGIENRPWSVFAVAAEQFSNNRGATWHEDREDEDNAYRFLTPDGDWSPALHLADDSLGFINILGWSDAYRTPTNTYRYAGVLGGFDASHYNEMLIHVRAFGRFNSDGERERYGIEDARVLHRVGNVWTQYDSANDDVELQQRSTVKVRLDDVLGLTLAWYGGIDTNDEQSSNVHAITDLPERRISFNMNFIGQSSNRNRLLAVSFHHFPTVYARCEVSIGVR